MRLDADIPERLLRIDEVTRRVGLSRAKVYAMIADGIFPKPYRVTRGAVRWRDIEVSEWIAGILAAQPAPKGARHVRGR
ncbi:helix-turn-helix transcriptional regulator [Sphingomonas adhaesiva]|uniref:helix-turn-helix transcriptional regulator n=1 Tax=Sphingomonas adhaesiva TaxID=28212 RepID=UPI002FF62D27